MIFFIIISSLLPALAQSQKGKEANQPDLSAYIREKHGFDQRIINGILYYNKYYRVLNHPYYSGEESFPGTVILSGKSYDDVQINYDIYEQHLVLEYQGLSEGLFKIIISPRYTDAFQLAGNYFEKLTMDDRGPLFYQVITVNDLSLYIHWEKQKMVTSNNLQHPYFFTDPKQSYFLSISDKLFPFSNKKAFVHLFSGVSKKDIRRYMRRSSIRFSDASPDKLAGLLEFIFSRMQSTSGN